MIAKFGPPNEDRPDILITLIEAYENKHFPLDFLDPVEAIKYRVEQSGLTVKGLEPMVGNSIRI